MTTLRISDLPATRELDRQARTRLRGGFGPGHGGGLYDPKRVLEGINFAFATQVAFAFSGGGKGPVIDQFTGIQI
ncbi:MAG: hypothetical protein PVF40_02225 [Ectothiorhodospiraceae bacterium]|jgi:hypothetical protein